MKTKISHLGRSTVSVILAVMMLLSTMLIGTVSTVNATTFDSGSNDFYLIGGMNGWSEKDSNWQLSTTDNNKYTGTFTIKGSSSNIDFKVFSNGKYYTNGKTYENDSAYGGLYEGGFNNNMQIKPATTDTSKTITLSVVFYKSYNNDSNDSRLEIKQTIVDSSATSTYYIAGEKGLINGTKEWADTDLEDNKMKYSNTDGYYSITYTDRISRTYPYQFKIRDNTGAWYGYSDFKYVNGTNCDVNESGGNISVTFTQKSNVTIKFNIDSENNKHLYVIAESALPKVADSVTLTASSETVTSGGSTTLTATLTGKAVSNVKLTLTGGDTTQTATVSGSDTTATFTVSPTSTTTYTVTASAENHSSKSATTTINVVGSDTYYLWTSSESSVANTAKWTRYEFSVDSDGNYNVPKVAVPESGDMYLTVTKTSDNPYNTMVWENQEAKNNSKNNSSYVGGIDQQQYYVSDTNKNYYYLRIYFKSRNGSLSVDYDTTTTGLIFKDAGSTPVGNVTINVPKVENAKVTAVANSQTYDEGASFDIKVGSSFTVNVKNEKGYTLKKIAYGTQSKTETGAEFTAEPGVKTFSVDMVQTVSNPVTVEFGSDNNGTVSAIHNGVAFTSGETVNVGDTVTIKATPSGSNYIFKSWSINGTYDIQNSKTTSDAEITIVVKSNITAMASFTQAAPFKVAYGSNTDVKTIDMVATKKDGIYVSTAPLANGTNFTIYDVGNNKYALKKDGDTWYINDLDASIDFEDWSNNPTIDGNAGGFRNNTSRPAYVFYNSNYSTVTLQTEPDFGDKAVLYVKTGTSGEGATGEYASKSEAPKLMATSSGTTYKKYSVEYDTNVNIQTTMSDKYLKARYYVAGYSVNGRSYPASAVDASKGIYQTNITITEDLAENGVVVEVTPIYYNRTIEEEDNYITFYVDAERLVGGWGSTVAIYAYAYKGGTAIYGSDGKPTNNVNLLGAYPGQPMVKDGQYYVAKIPRYSYEMSSDGSLVIDEESPVAGITLNNYYNDAVHNSLVPIKRNMQTYDFSDFVALAKKKDVKTIMFQSKFYNATGDANRNTSVVFGTAGEIADLNPKNPISNIGDAATIKVNPYEDFTDYYGRATDLIGNILDDTQKADENNLYVISTGSYNNQSPDYSTKGQWVTIWNVYDHSGNLITYGTPADFLNEDTEPYKKIANNENYKGKPVKISYEKGLSYDNGVTSRTDGRWYYSTLGQEFTSDVAIEYKGVDDKYIADTNTNTANTGFIGETSGATATINDVTTASFSSVTDTAHLNIKVANGWRFDGWYIKQGDKYTEVSDNYTDISTDILMSNSYHIVARVSKIPTGTLELNHTAYTGTDPTAHEGTGFYYISAVVKRADNSQINFDETQGKISIDNFAATDSLEITLRAKCHGDNTVYALYKGEAGGYTKIGDKDYEGDPSFSYTFKVSANSLFEGNKLAVNALNYYTDIVKVGGTCDITYMYKDRFGVEGEGKMVSYVVRNVELSTEEIQDNYQPSDSTITKYAPRIDTMYLETKWNLKDAEKVKKGESQATVIATQTKKTCKVYHPTLEGGYYTDIADSKPYKVDYNSLLMDEGGKFFLSAPEIDKNGKQFSYWDVYKADINGSKTELVTKCYEHNFGLRIMADYYIEPVYGKKAPSLTANINAPVLNREIYGDSANPKDKLYADLLTAFTSTAIPTFKENKTDLKVECGVFVVRNNTSTLSVDDRNTLVNAAATGAVDTTSDILAKYKMTSQVETSVKSQLEKLAVDSSVKNNTNNTYKFDSDDDYRVTKFVFDNNSLTNKNRIDKVLRYTNNTANQNYIFTAYAFVVIKDSHGTVQEMKISDPQYFNLCYVGNKAL